MELKNKRIWITGASSGIGEALTYHLSEKGAQLIISSRKIEDLKRVQKGCAHPDQVKIVTLDLQDHARLDQIASNVLAQAPVDILINNGGISQRSIASETPLELDKKIMDINFFGTIALTKAVLPTMLERKSGQIVVVSSLVGKFGSPLRSGYAGSKHALHGFFDSLRAEVHKDNISVTILCPGYVRTDISMNALTKSGSPQNKMDDKTAAGLTPEQFARKATRAIVKNKNEDYIGKSEILGIYVKRLFPGLFARIIRKVKVT